MIFLFYLYKRCQRREEVDDTAIEMEKNKPVEEAEVSRQKRFQYKNLSNFKYFRECLKRRHKCRQS